MKRILLALDFTEASKNALTYSRYLAAQMQAALHVLHVSHTVESPMILSETMREQVLKVNEEMLKDKLLRMATPYPNKTEEPVKPLVIEYHVGTGDITGSILAKAQEVQASLLVIGVRKKHNIWEQMLGSTSTLLLKKSEIPLLLIPESVSYKSIHRAALALDPELDIARVMLMANALLAEWPLTVLPFFVNTRPEEQDLFKEEQQQVSGHQVTIVRDSTVATGIHYFLEKHPCEILALHLPRRAFIDQLLHGKLSRHLAFHLDIPLLVF
ncbi:MAG TPA: universal stress protein [Saprospiraceae bacterium]|nr:universal stress protein [Saprospiraceae bacterium]HMQ82519.1 universal stress protein [Saprospiraceae bacterium]